MIKTKCVREPASPEDGLRVLVTRTWPRGLPQDAVDVWWKELAPSAKLLADWRQKRITWGEYEERYRLEMEALPAHILIQGFWNMDAFEQDVVITLLCVEAEENPQCHRHILKAIIE